MQLEAKNIGFRTALDHGYFSVNVTVEPGEIVGLTGPSGSGKTTFCRILAGFEKPMEGTITLDGLPVSAKGFHPVQLVFQHPEKAVNPRWKMDEVLNEGGSLIRLLALLGIEQEWLTRWPNELSGGELQRFCVARALGPATRFLIADEMTTMLMPSHKHKSGRLSLKLLNRERWALSLSAMRQSSSKGFAIESLIYEIADKNQALQITNFVIWRFFHFYLSLKYTTIQSLSSFNVIPYKIKSSVQFRSREDDCLTSMISDMSLCYCDL